MWAITCSHRSSEQFLGFRSQAVLRAHSSCCRFLSSPEAVTQLRGRSGNGGGLRATLTVRIAPHEKEGEVSEPPGPAFLPRGRRATPGGTPRRGGSGQPPPVPITASGLQPLNGLADWTRCSYGKSAKRNLILGIRFGSKDWAQGAWLGAVSGCRPGGRSSLRGGLPSGGRVLWAALSAGVQPSGQRTV